MKTKKIIEAGPLVLECIYPRGSAQDSPRQRSAKRQLSSEAQQRMNRKYSYQKLELMIAANFRPGDWIVTLTYDDEHLPRDRAEAQERLKRFRGKLARARRRHGQQLRMIWNTETVFGQGRWHHHCIISRGGGRDFALLRSLWPWGMNIEIHPLRIDRDHSFESLARYLCKEARERRGLRSWSSTRSCVKPRVDVCTVPDSAQLQPPKGATIYEDEQRRTEYGSFRFVKYLVPDWRKYGRRRRGNA